jgi:hypothetical protein
VGQATHAFLSTLFLTLVVPFYKWLFPLQGSAENHTKPVRNLNKSDHQALDSFLQNMACISTFQSCSITRGAKINTRTKGSGGRGSPTFQCRASTFDDGSLRLELDENPDAIISGEWTENFSLLSYDDLRAYLLSQQTVQVVDQVLDPRLFFCLLS